MLASSFLLMQYFRTKIPRKTSLFSSDVVIERISQTEATGQTEADIQKNKKNYSVGYQQYFLVVCSHSVGLSVSPELLSVYDPKFIWLAAASH